MNPSRSEAERGEGWQGRGAKGPEVYLKGTSRTFRDDDEVQRLPQPAAVGWGLWIGSKGDGCARTVRVEDL